MGFWDKMNDKDINEARSTEGGLYLVPGTYLLQIQSCKMITTRNRDDAFVAEFEVKDTDVDDKSLQPGSKPAYFVNMNGKFPELSLGNVADFMRVGLAASAEGQGIDHPSPDAIELNSEIADSITGEDNILAGVYVRAIAFNKPTREGKDFTRIKWEIPSNARELVAAAG